jgi:hypothetical protein
MNKKMKILCASGMVVIVFMIVYAYAITHFEAAYPCSENNFHNTTVCVHCYSSNFKCTCQQFELYTDAESGFFDCNICPPYKAGDLWHWMNCGNLTKEFTIG